jgi:hypothetical protein
MAARVLSSPHSILRHSDRDAVFVVLAAAHGLALVLAPSIAVIAVGLWWNANTVAHNFIHRPFFRSGPANGAFSAWLTLVLGFPQRLWRDRHLRHHAETARSRQVSRGDRSVHPVGLQTLGEISLVFALWTALGILAPRFFLLTYLPGWFLGLLLCQVQGHFEHARGTTSHYGRLYNVLFFNDGYHVEHHEHPGAHWSELRQGVRPHGRVSRWPPILRWLEWIDLEFLERLVMRSPLLQRFVLRRHERAFAALLPRVCDVNRATIVGGGLFPRTALVLRRLLPDATLTIVDASDENLEVARGFLKGHEAHVDLVHDLFTPNHAPEADLLVIPLSFMGDRRRLYRRPPAPAVFVHDWVWSRRGAGAVVSWFLLKRLNLVMRA